MIKLKDDTGLCAKKMVDGKLYLAIAKNKYVSATPKEVVVKFANDTDPFFTFCSEAGKWTYVRDPAFVDENYTLADVNFECNFIEV